MWTLVGAPKPQRHDDNEARTKENDQSAIDVNEGSIDPKNSRISFILIFPQASWSSWLCVWCGRIKWKRGPLVNGNGEAQRG
jgi:hypothetical protein